jgi:hypothetical protein
MTLSGIEPATFRFVARTSNTVLSRSPFHNLSISIKTHTKCSSDTHWTFESHTIWAVVYGKQKTRSYMHRRSNFNIRQSTLLLLTYKIPISFKNNSSYLRIIQHVSLAPSTCMPSEVTVSNTKIQWNVHIWSYTYINDIYRTPLWSRTRLIFFVHEFICEKTTEQ